MRLRLLAPIACLSACLCLAACGSDSSPTSSKTDPDDDTDIPPPNGTITADGDDVREHFPGGGPLALCNRRLPGCDHIRGLQRRLREKIQTPAATAAAVQSPHLTSASHASGPR